ncbi:autotransporter outer membrane beta-barrel domain-containing protein [Xanthobacter autotrophicus]|uniref:autotransporter outer membrane beta-barrel domain-containing protein n=1 Tax=Xanthobacter autotrophicus TaxID=280 RepID=UPI00372A9205
MLWPPVLLPTMLLPIAFLLPASQAVGSTCGDGNPPAGGICTIQPFSPTVNDAQVGATVVTGNDVVTLQGPLAFESGSGGAVGRQPLQNFTIISGASTLSDPVLDLGGQTQAATYTDPVTGAVRTVNVYGSAGMSTSPFGSTSVANIEGVGDNQYIDARIATVDSSGGTLNVSVAGDMNIAAKQTTLVKVDGTGSASSSVVWTSSNTIGLFGVTMPADAQDSVTTDSVPGWPTTVALPDGTSVTINNLADFQAFNAQLITLVEDGTIDQVQYDSLIAQGANLQSATVVYQYSPVPPQGDDIYQPVGLRTVMEATGANASATLASGATLTVTGTNGGVLRGTNGASVTNKGTIAIVGGSGITLDTGGKGYNEGVINARAASNGVVTLHSTFTNSGIINQAAGTSTGTLGFGGGVGINSIDSTTLNSGIINVGTEASTANASITGVRVSGGSFTNTETGLIYIGRAEQSDPAVATADVAIDVGGPVTGIKVESNSQVTNAGQIVIGSLTQGAVGLRVDSASNATVNNTGSIIVKGAAESVPRENVGYLVRNTGTSTGSTIRNDGAITVQGVNGTGLKVLADGVHADMVSTGAITVAGGADPSSGTRNYGVWVEGTNGGTAKAEIDGKLTLTGDGAIGVLARGDAQVTVGADSTPSFANGSDQIGFFIYGSGASITTAASVMHVGTERSTLFRIAEGATFDSSQFTVVASGVDSVGIVATGQNTKVTDTGGLFDLTGAGATGVVAEGGAVVSLDATRIYLNAEGAVGAIADGQGHDLTGAAVGLPDAATKLSFSGLISSSTGGVTGLAATNSGALEVKGNVTLTGDDSVGIFAQKGATVAVKGANVSVNGFALEARNQASTFTVDNAILYGSDGLLNAATTAHTKLTATGSSLWGGIFTAVGSSSDVKLLGGTLWTMDQSSNVSYLTSSASSIVFTTPSSGFKTLTVGVNYAGADASMAMSTTLNNGLAQLTDKVVVGGNTSGNTTLFINNSGGLGAQTVGNGIEVVDVAGASAGSFTLGNSLYAGAYEYDLFQGGVTTPGDGDWYLRSSLTAAAQVASPYLDSLLKFQQLSIGTLQQRLGNRQWPVDGGVNLSAKAAKAAGVSQGASGGGIWGRVQGLHGSEDPDQGTPYDRELWFAQAGADFVVYRHDTGLLVASIMGTYGNQSVDVNVTPDPTTHLLRSGAIATDAYGAGGSLTWFGTNGFYVDGVGQYTWFDSDLSASDLGSLAKGNGAQSYALSLEAGGRMAINRIWSWVPQAQLIYSNARFDDFRVTYSSGDQAVVTPGDGDSLLGRIGVRLENVLNLGGGSRFQGYGIANLMYDFLGATDVTFGSSILTQEGQALWGEMGIGGTYVFNSRFAVYGEGNYATSLESFGSSSAYRGNLGVRMSW